MVEVVVVVPIRDTFHLFRREKWIIRRRRRRFPRSSGKMQGGGSGSSGAGGAVGGGLGASAVGAQFLSPAGGGSGTIAGGVGGGAVGQVAQQQQQSGGGIGPPAAGGNASGGAKRGRGRPMPGAGTGGVSAYKIGEAAPAPRRKKRKAPEKQIPDRVAALLPESALYSQLLEFEARVDAALARKKMDIQDAVRAPARLLRTLRIYVFNTYANQVNSAPAMEMQNPYMREPPSWTLRIMGRILEDSNEPENQPQSAQQFQALKNHKFSSFFRRVTFQLDRNLYHDNHTIVWDVTKAGPHVEGFEIKRKGDQEFKVYIRLEMNYSPERFKLSAALAEMLGMEVETRPRIIAALWQYIKAKKLQSSADPTIVNCDPPLQKILGDEKIKFAYISNKLQQHLSAPPPIVLEHSIKLSGKMPVGNACYDVQVDIPAPLHKEMNNFLQNIEKHRDIDMYDDMICTAISKINEHRRRRAFFLGFSHSPVDFINGLIASQSRDLKMVGGQASRNAEKERRSDFYNQPWVEDAVIRYLNRKPAKTTEAPGTT
ncbi:hypothetical protein Mapa_000317 [Marchantia paleacea]|nr:hypothetical protein Mapa_000317 [Marchantia paleacea]